MPTSGHHKLWHTQSCAHPTQIHTHIFLTEKLPIMKTSWTKLDKCKKGSNDESIKLWRIRQRHTLLKYSKIKRHKGQKENEKRKSLLTNKNYIINKTRRTYKKVNLKGRWEVWNHLLSFIQTPSSLYHTEVASNLPLYSGDFIMPFTNSF